MAIKTFISFSPSPFLCNLLVSSPGYVSCLVCLFENQWCGALSHFPPPASAGSLLFPLPEPFACSHPGQGQNAVGTPADVAFLHLLTHLFSPIPCLPAWGLLCCLKSSYLDFLVPLLHESLSISGRHCSTKGQWIISEVHDGFPLWAAQELWGLLGGVGRCSFHSHVSEWGTRSL